MLKYTCESKCLFHSTEEFTDYFTFITLLTTSNLSKITVFKDFLTFY